MPVPANHLNDVVYSVGPLVIDPLPETTLISCVFWSDDLGMLRRWICFLQVQNDLP